MSINEINAELANFKSLAVAAPKRLRDSKGRFRRPTIGERMGAKLDRVPATLGEGWSAAITTVLTLGVLAWRLF